MSAKNSNNPGVDFKLAQDVIAVLENLKGIKLQWYVFGDGNLTTLESELKNVTENDGIQESLSFNLKGPGKKRIKIDAPYTFKIEKTNKYLRIKFYSKSGKMNVMVGYVKGV